MIKKIYENKKEFFLTFIVFSIHLLFLKFNPVNFEFTFSEGAKYFVNFEKKVIEDFFFNQANTFVFSLLIGIFDKVFFINDTLVAARILSALSYFLLAIGFINIFHIFNIKFNLLLFLILFFLNPLIWTYGHRGIPDLLATSIAFYSCSSILLYKSKKKFKNFFSFVILGLAICLKPFCLIYLFLIFVLEYKQNLISYIRKYFILFLSALFLPLIYFLLIKINFDFFLIPPKFNSEVIFLKGGFFNNFFGYFIFLSVFILPFSFKLKFVNKFNILVILFLILPLSFYFHYLTNSPSTELNFGFLSKILDVRLIFFFAFSSLFLLILYIKDNFNINYEFLIVVFVYIFVLSLTRSSQRYLIPILPIMFLFFLVNKENFEKKIFFYLICIGYFFINIFISINFYLNSSINKEIINYLIKKNIIEETLPGALYAHSYHYFLSQKNKKYIISSEPNDHLRSFERKFFVINKRYYLNKIN